MAIYPKIQSPCPVKNQLSAVMDGDMCRLCKRQVFDLSDMNDAQRVAFFKSCSGEVCVSYRIRPALAAAAIAALAMSVPVSAAAQIETVSVEAGAIKDPKHVEFVQDPGDTAIPALPVVYDDAKTPANSTPARVVTAKAPT